MTPTERRQRLLEVLCIRRYDTCDNLAHEFHVANSTIRRDLEILTCSYPIETVRGRYGGVRVADGYYLYRKTLTPNQAEVNRNQMLLMSLYENLNDGIIDRDEYLDLKKTYTRRREEAEQQADDIRAEMEQEISHSSKGHKWIDRFRRYQNITELDRTIVVSLIERILVYRDHRVEIVYRWKDEYRWYLDLLIKAQEMPPEKEAM